MNEDEIQDTFGYPDCTGDCNYFDDEGNGGEEFVSDNDLWVPATASPGIAG